MNRRTYWGLGILILLLMAGGAVLFYSQYTELQQLKQESAEAEKLLKEKNKPIADTDPLTVESQHPAILDCISTIQTLPFHTEPFQNNETHSSVPIPKPPPETENNNAHHLDANLDDLPKVLEKELFKDVPPELLADIEFIVSDEDTKSLLEKLQSDPNLNKEKQVYIDIIKQSIEDKKYIETQQ